MSNLADNDVVIVGMARTPIGGFLGSLSSLGVVDLGAIAARAAMQRAGVAPGNIDEVWLGIALKAGAKGNPARQVQLAVDIPVEVPATSVDHQCASSMRARDAGMMKIQLGRAQAVLACGAESMSNAPYLLLNARKGLRMGPGRVEDELLYGGLHDAFSGEHMGVTAENVAEMYGVTREEQDKMALLSQERCAKAQSEGWFTEEIVPVEIKGRKGVTVMDKDEHPRLITLEQLAKMRPAFKKDGTITAGNASGMNDGACAAVIMSAGRAREMGIKPLAKIRSVVSVGCEPRIMGIGPIYAVPKALKEAGLTAQDIEYYEINEAFAAQAIPCIKELGIDMDKVNACGSGISLGHPPGMTGLRIIITGYHEMKRRGATLGCAALCVGGGPAMATVFERLA